jgi:crotonobetainyl-CoA:carnitine CoA-transferase CaiB-like acyl-CoA transferase
MVAVSVARREKYPIIQRNEEHMTIKKLPLEGVRVVEFVHMVMGPTCGLILADLGAEVIKVEPMPGGDKTRNLSGGGSGFFPAFNRNKKSIVLDVKSAEGLALARKLVATADVVTENFRPGAMDKLGLGYETLKAENPGLIFMSAKGFLTGPYEHRTALDEVVQMMTGLAYMTGLNNRPLRVGASVNDIMGGMFSVIAILCALLQRKESGHGARIETGLFETCSFLMAQHMAAYAMNGLEPLPMAEANRGAWSIYNVFDTSEEGEQVFVGVVTDTQWEIFCKNFNFPDLLYMTEMGNKERTRMRDDYLPRVRERFKEYTKAALIDKCEELGLPYSPIQKPTDLYDDPHLLASGGLLTMTEPGGNKVVVPGLPMSVDGERYGMRRDPPKAGADADDILASLGLGEAEVSELRARKVVG